MQREKTGDRNVMDCRATRQIFIGWVREKFCQVRQLLRQWGWPLLPCQQKVSKVEHLKTNVGKFLLVAFMENRERLSF
jgi:hypothetical protein